MIQQFVERNLNRTIEFLCKIGMAEPCSIVFSPTELLATNYQNSRDFSMAYTILLCETSRPLLNSFVFCKCCSSRIIFLRNHSLLKSMVKNNSFSDPLINKCIPFTILPGVRMDPFLCFIKAFIHRDYNMALDVVNQLPLFWEAHLLLLELSSSFAEVYTPLAPFFYAHLKIVKDIDPPGIHFILTRNSTIDLSILPYSTEKLDRNTLAALNYCYGNDKKALELFKSIDCTITFDPAFFEFYGMLLHNNEDTSFQLVSEALVTLHKNKPETCVFAGLCCLSIGNYTEAKALFKRGYKYKSTADIACLLAYATLKLNDNETASGIYQLVGRDNSKNFRILYSIAQGYFNMNKFPNSLAYCKKALLIREDGSIYKLMGKVCQGLGDMELAIRYFEHALKLAEVDALLYLAEIYKKKGDVVKVLELYDKYVKNGESNVEAVVKYLIDYYEERGDFEKMEYYKQYLKAT
ncbi:hypothetical protein GINT2_001719 [Glugoides intestinalis]